VGLAFDLNSEFTCWREDESVRTLMPVAIVQGRKMADVVEHRNDEGSGLTGAYNIISMRSSYTHLPVLAMPIRSRFCIPIGIACL